jgi:hypothetical protein
MSTFEDRMINERLRQLAAKAGRVVEFMSREELEKRDATIARKGQTKKGNIWRGMGLGGTYGFTGSFPATRQGEVYRKRDVLKDVLVGTAASVPVAVGGTLLAGHLMNKGKTRSAIASTVAGQVGSLASGMGAAYALSKRRVAAIKRAREERKVG